MRARLVNGMRAVSVLSVCIALSSCSAESATTQSRPGASGSGNSGGSRSTGVSGSSNQSPSSGGTQAAAGTGGIAGADSHTGATGGIGTAGASGNGSSGAGGGSTLSNCTKTTGCSAEKPVCDTAANGGLGECKQFKLLAFYTVYEQMADLAHRSYSREANAWFPSVAAANGFSFESTTNWDRLKNISANDYQLVMFFDNVAHGDEQRKGFKAYMDKGGAFIGFHVSAWNDNPSQWDWYYNQLLGCGGFKNNTWRPTPANLKVEDTNHPVTQGLGAMFKTSANEWYSWNVDLRTKSNIKVLLSIDPSSFPLGTSGVWNSGYYPVVWANTEYKAMYVNMGHNDMDYGNGNAQLSWTFRSELQDKMLLNGIRWLVGAQGASNVTHTD